MPESANPQVGNGGQAEAEADLEHQEEIKQAQVLQREGVETALMEEDSSEVGEQIDAVQNPDEEDVA